MTDQERAEIMKRHSADIGREYYNRFCSQRDRQKPKSQPKVSTGSVTPAQKADSNSNSNQTNSNTITDFLCREVPREFDKYYTQMRILKTLLAETRASFDEINQFGYFDFETPFSPLKVIENEDFGLAETATKPPCIVILGQDNVAKATVIRELFGEELIPIKKVDEDLELQRVVRFSFGRRQEYTVTTLVRASSVSSAYEMITEEEDARDEAEEDSSESVSDSGDYCHVQKTGFATPRRPSNQSSNSMSASSSFKSNLYKNIRLKSDDRQNESLSLAILEVQMPHAFLRGGGEILVGPCNNPFMTTEDFFRRHVSEVFPIVIYALSYHKLGAEDIRELQVIKEMKRDLPIFFIKAFDDTSYELTESAQYEITQLLRMQLVDLGFIQLHDDDHSQVMILEDEEDEGYFSNKRQTFESSLPMHALARGRFDCKKVEVNSVLCEAITDIEQFVSFLVKALRSHLANLSTLLHNTHTYVLKYFVATAYELSRDCQITPKKISYTREKELELYQSLMSIANKQQNELRFIIHETIHGTREEILKEAADFSLSQSQSLSSYAEVKTYRSQIENLVLTKINERVVEKMRNSTQKLNENFTGILQRCLKTLEENLGNRKNGDVDDEKSDLDQRPAQAALQSILDAAYSVELPVHSEDSEDPGAFNFVMRMKELISSISFKTPQPTDFTADWKMATANKLISGLNESKLAKNVCQQFRNRLQDSHDKFLNALKNLEARQATKLEKNEECRMQVRKNLAPKIARLAMESLSLRDGALYGMPKLDGEIGRGQYGVVYGCQSGWAQYPNVAVKSLLPPDEKHWNDLAMEYYYTRSLPYHDRIVQIRGSVIDHNYGGGHGQVAALLIMDRYPRDLYSAIKSRLGYPDRLQVALDVVDGLRFLHGQGLVHRDIKLKNILLDEKNRGKITDLGFCKPEAMMSGSIVGTPIHMAPELLKGNYDHSVDTYAFGILFWYVCAGTVKLPHNFEQCTSKEHLWNVVQRGVRPEKLQVFEEDSWKIMSECWDILPQRRPHLGYVRPRLENLVVSAHNRVVISPETSRVAKAPILTIPPTF